MPPERQPHLFIFNVSKAGARHTCDTADAPHLFLASFASALESARARVKVSGENGKAVVQGAVWGPEGATIFIDTEDEEWDRVIGIGRREDIEKRLVVSRVLQETEGRGDTPQSQELAAGTQQTKKNLVSVFKIAESSPTLLNQHTIHHADGANESESESEEPQPLLKAFVDAIYTLINEGVKVEAAMYGPEEGAKIFVK